MKCGTYVVRNKRGQPTRWFTPMHRVVHKNLVIPPEAKLCDGEITVALKATVSDGCSCCGYPELEISYVCKKCSSTYFGELPRDEKELSEFLQEAIGHLTTAQRKHLLGERKEEEDRRQKMTEEASARLEADLEAVRKMGRKALRKGKVKKK